MTKKTEQKRVAESAKFAEPTPVFTSDQDVSTTASVVFIIGSN